MATFRLQKNEIGKIQSIGRSFSEYMTRAKVGIYKVQVERVQETRSLALNAYYWGVVLYEISKHTGFTEEELHEEFAALFLSVKTVSITDRRRRVKRVRSTATLPNDEFLNYLSNIGTVAVRLGIRIPKPNEIPDEARSEFR